MNRWGARLASMTVLGTTLVAASTGCVSGQTYELAKSRTENAKLLYESEQRRAQELAAANRLMKQQLAELEASLHNLREQLDHKDKDWREARDELLKLKIEKEQQRASKSRSRMSDAPPGLEQDRPLIEPEAEARLKHQAPAEETKRRVRELVQQLQALLQQF